EVRVDDESRPLANERLEAARTQLIADRRAGAALPHDRAVDRATCNALPHDGRLALVGDADRRNVAGIRLRRGKRIARDGGRRGVPTEERPDTPGDRLDAVEPLARGDAEHRAAQQHVADGACPLAMHCVSDLGDDTVMVWAERRGEPWILTDELEHTGCARAV